MGMSYFAKVRLWDGTDAAAITNDGAVGAEDSRRLQVAAGDRFLVSYIYSGVASNASTCLYLSGAAGGQCWAVIGVEGGDSVEVRLYEGTVMSTAGTGVTPVNLNRDSAATAAWTFYRDGVLSTVGTEIYQGVAGHNPCRVGGMAAPASEWGLATSQTYLLKTINRTGAAADIGVTIEFHEG